MIVDKLNSGKRYSFSRFIRHLSPTRIIVIGFLTLIAVGTALLSLPISSNSPEGTNLVDAFFTSTSAVCVTGLVVLNTATHWTAFGKMVIIMLIQVGGLGFMTVLTMFFLLRRRKITFKERLLIQESLNQNTLNGIVRLVKNILLGTIIIETIGAVIIALRFIPERGILQAIPIGIFQSVSSFCNAGFDILGPNSIEPYATDFIINFSFIALIVIGGLGFTVWIDVMKAVSLYRKGQHTVRQVMARMELHTKIVLTATLFLLTAGTVLFFAFEYSNEKTIGGFNLWGKFIASFMQSATTRTAGYAAIPQGELTYASKFLSIILMFIGGSPAGTAGGIKTVTVAVLLISAISVTHGENKIFIWGRRISFSTMQKSLAVFLVSIGVLVFATMVLTVTERNMPVDYQFMDLFFETASALGTTGISTGITPHLSTLGRVVISVVMFIGRIGPVSIVFALARRQNDAVMLVEYPEGNVMVG